MKETMQSILEMSGSNPDNLQQAKDILYAIFLISKKSIEDATQPHQ